MIVIMKLRIVEEFTKQSIQNIYSIMFDEFLNYSEELGFCTNSDVNYEVKWMRNGATRALGQCRLKGTSYRGGSEIVSYEVALNPFLLEFDDTNQSMIKDVIAHEFCHTLPDCYNHGTEFHKKAKLIYDLMGYKIDTKADQETSKHFNNIIMNEPPYKVVCDNCGAEQKFVRLTQQLKNASYYKCSQCNKPYLVTYKLDKRTGQYKELIPRKTIDAIRELHHIPAI